MASISATPCTRAASRTCWNISCILWISSAIRAPNFDLPETRRACAVAGAHHLFWLALAAVGDAPESPVLAPGDGDARIPELRRNSAIAGILQHADPLTIADLPANFASELK